MSRQIMGAIIAAFVLAGCVQPKDTSEDIASGHASEPTDATPISHAASVGEMCGGIAGLVCAEDLYCDMPIGDCIQIADAAGVCAVKPDFCTKEYDPVCGCDGETHGNTCEANAEGVSVASTGACQDQN